GETVVIDTHTLALVGADSTANGTVLDYGDSSGTALGLFADTQTDLLVKNLRVQNSGNGIHWNNVDQSIIRNVTTRAMGIHGISLKQGSDTNRLTGIHSLSNSSQGIKVENGDSLTLQYSLAKNNQFQGIEVINSNNSTITDNRSISNSGGATPNGFELDNVDNSRITNNVSSNNGNIGMYMLAMTNNKVTKNVISSNSSEGILLHDTSSFNTFKHNTERNNSQEGVDLGTTSTQNQSPDTNTFTQNRIVNNTLWVFDFNGESSGTFSQNNLKTSSTHPDSYVQSSLSNDTVSLARNYWNTTDHNKLQNGIKASGADSVIIAPFRLGKVDTGVGADSIAPEIPGSDTAIPDDGQVTVKWSKVTQDEDGSALDFSEYRVYRTTFDTVTDWKSNATQVATISSVSDTDHVDNGVTNGDTYYYRVTAVDASTPENESFFSDTVVANPKWTGPTWYVNDNSTNNDLFTTTTGSDSNTGGPNDPLGTIKYAMNNKVSAGDTLKIDAGTYSPGDSVTIPANNVSLVGVDSGVTTIDFNNTGSTLNLAVKASNRQNLLFEQFAITRGYNGVLWKGVTNSTIRNVRSDTHGRNGMILKNNSDTNLILNTTSESNTSDGLVLDGSDANDVKQLVSTNNFYGIRTTSITGLTLKNSIVTGNSSDGVNLSTASFSKLHQNVISNNSDHGIEVSGGNDNQVIQNRIANNSKWGVSLSSSTVTDTVTKNNILPSSTNPDSGLQNPSGFSHVITRNYWNTTDESLLDQRIVDSVNNFRPYRLGKVDTGVGADTIAPADVTKDTAIPDDQKITVKWKEVTTNENGQALPGGEFTEYRIYRTTSDTLTDWKQNATQVTTIGTRTDTDYVDSSLTNGDTYYYRVTAVDDASPENESFFSDTVSAVPPGPINLDTTTISVADQTDTLFYSELNIDTKLHESENHTITVFAEEADTVTAYFRRDGTSATTNDTPLTMNVADSTTAGDTWKADLTPDTHFSAGDTINFILQAEQASTGDTTISSRSGSGHQYEAQNDVFSVVSQPLGSDSGVDRSSVAWGDYDRNGELDLAVSGTDNNSTHRLLIYQNDGSGNFTQVAEPMGANAGVNNSSIQWGDYDSDGDLDLVVTGRDNSSSRRFIVFRNDGGSSFTNVAEPMGAGSGINSSSVDWGDYDNDGDLDLLVTGDDGTNERVIVYRNDGGGTFTIAAEPMGTNFGVRLSGAEWGDYDNDGDLDFAVTGEDNNTTNRFIVFRNDDGTFTNIAEPMGSNDGLDQGSLQWGDYDGDGDLDILLSGQDASANRRLIVFRNDGGGAFTNASEPFGSNSGVFGSDAAWADFDNDGDLDIAASGDLTTGDERRFHIYRNDGSDSFSRVAEPLGQNEGLEYASLQWGDADRDGLLDLIVTGEEDSDNRFLALRNIGGFTSNSRPSAPTISSPTGDTFVEDTPVNFSWTGPTGDETAQSALTYNLRVGTQSGTADVVPADVDGFNEAHHELLGNVQNGDTHSLDSDTTLTPGTYYWSVQAVDGGQKRSSWATEYTFDVREEHPGFDTASLQVADGTDTLFYSDLSGDTNLSETQAYSGHKVNVIGTDVETVELYYRTDGQPATTSDTKLTMSNTTGDTYEATIADTAFDVGDTINFILRGIDNAGDTVLEDSGSAGFEYWIKAPDHNGPIWYVNDSSQTGDAFTSRTGNDRLYTGSSKYPFRTVSHALEHASDGDTTKADAGTYGETTTIRHNNFALIGADSSASGTIIDGGDTSFGAGADVRVEHANNVLVKNLRARGAYNGVKVISKSSIFRSLTVVDNGSTGFETDNSAGTGLHTITNVVSKSNGLRGFTIGDDTNTVKGNVSKNNSDAGFNIYTTSGNTFSNNRVINNSLDGFLIQGGSNFVFRRNVATGNADDGFEIAGSGHEFYQNTVKNNTKYQFNVTGGSSNMKARQNNVSYSTTNPDSGVGGSITSDTADFKRNYWQTTDASVIKQKIKTSIADSVVYSPYRLGSVDTGTTADSLAPASPTSDTALNLGADTIEIRWSKVTQDEDGSALDFHKYRVYRTKSDTLTD
ncbi:MAG: right-handed parallel beta-helix repeat-containing protein, partial [bacterium]